MPDGNNRRATDFVPAASRLRRIGLPLLPACQSAAMLREVVPRSVMPNTAVHTGMRSRAVTLLRELYESGTQRGVTFRYALLIFDLIAILFVIATSFIERNTIIEWLDVAFGLAFLADFLSRVIIRRGRMRMLAEPVTYADAVAILSFLAPVAGEGLGFLRILRTLRFLRTYQVVARLRGDFVLFRRHEDLVIAVANLAVFLFIMTGLIYETQYRRNPDISNYADALYFTVTALTTTGFGDITLPGTSGRLLSVLVMIVGVGLFLRLAQTLFRPTKVRYECPTCGLTRHDPDAVHCKHCGTTLHIETEGQ
jgi:voltage-gated potassium channel